MKIIGITGTNGAGKGTVVSYLVKNHGFAHFSVREYLVQKILEKGMQVNRDSMRVVANEIREEYGAGYIVKELYLRAIELNQPSIIESIRCVGEVLTLQELQSFELWAVDADIETRYQRSIERGSSTDNITLEEFIEKENLESTSDDPAKQNLPKCIELSTRIFYNNGSIEELEIQIEQLLSQSKEYQQIS